MTNGTVRQLELSENIRPNTFFKRSEFLSNLNI